MAQIDSILFTPRLGKQGCTAPRGPARSNLVKGILKKNDVEPGLNALDGAGPGVFGSEAPARGPRQGKPLPGANLSLAHLRCDRVAQACKWISQGLGCVGGGQIQPLVSDDVILGNAMSLVKGEPEQILGRGIAPFRGLAIPIGRGIVGLRDTLAG